MDEDHVLSDDSCFESDMEDDVTKIIYRDLNQAEINTLSDFKKICCIYFYTQINVKLCSSCIVRLSDLFSHLRAVRKHDTSPYLRTYRWFILFELSKSIVSNNAV